MANSLTLELRNFDELKRRFSAIEKKIVEDINSILNVGAEDIATAAKTLVRVDEGGLRQSISADNSRLLEKHITVNAVYAAFVEFGTGQYAAQYVATLPENWQQFALQFKGKTGGSLDQFLLILVDWVHRHSLHPDNALTGTFSVKSKRRTGGKSQQLLQDYEVAYAIMLKILKYGVAPHPFLFPAFEHYRPIIIENINTVLNEM